MAVTQIDSVPLQTVSDRPRYLVQVKRTWADVWQTVPYLEPVSANATIAPAVPTALFRYRYGTIKREDSPGFEVFDPLALANWYIRIVLANDVGSDVLWVGIVADESFRPHGDMASPSGDQTLTAYGLEHLLDRVSIRGAYVDGGARIEWTPAFNAHDGWGVRRGAGNRSAMKQLSSYVFSREGHYWSNLDIVEYVLDRHWNGFPLTLSGQFDVLSSISGTYHFEGLTIKQILDKLIDRRRGLGWRIQSDGEYTSVHVFTLLTRPIAVGSKRIPENPNQEEIILDGAIDVDFAMITVSQAQMYDRIVVQGERAKVQFSVSVAGGTLVPDWDAGLESDYISVDDKQRSDDRFRAVYQRFIISPDFSGNHIVPVFDNNATMTGTGGPFWNDNRPLLRSLLTDDIPPQAYVDVPESGAALVDQLDKHGLHPAHVRVLDDRSGIELRPVINHILAKNHFNPETAAESSYHPEVDYSTLRAIVAIETDVRPVVDVRVGGETDTERTLTLQAYNVEFWYDADEGAIVRDDTEQLRAIAAMALGWYSELRGVFRMRVRDVMPSPAPGVMVVSVTSSWHREPVGTVVSNVHYDFDAAATTIETGHAELDFAALIDVPGMSDLRSVGRAFNRQQSELSRLGQHMGNLPARTAVSGGTGGGGVPVKILDKISGRRYRVNIYGDGVFDESGNLLNPTQTAVECWQIQIDVNETIPAGTWAIATKINGKWYMQVPVWL